MQPSERVLLARLAAHSKWAKTPDPTAATAPARAAFNDRFEREADPDGILEPLERSRRAEHLRKAYFTRLALKSAQSRRRSKELSAEADAADKILAEHGGDAA
jgi:hypothetical protein